MSSDFKEKIDKLIINSPFKEPLQHWDFEKTRGQFFIKEERRLAGYVIASQSKKYAEAGNFIELPLVNKIRPRIKKWRENNYPGVTGITKRLLEFWNTKEADGRAYEFFFCQKEAIETLIWLKETPDSEKTGINIVGDGGEFERLCCKMATGTGKTFVMSMVIAWQVLNKAAYPKDTRFSKNIFVVAPNLTVKSRLSVVDFNNLDNYYEQNKIVPHDLLPQLRQGKILIENWHTLMWESEEAIEKKRSVDKRGAKSNEAYVRDILGDMAKSKNILVINDEAHHSWRHRREEKIKGVSKKDMDMATCWVKGLDRIHKTRGISTCFDFSATPFAPSGTKGKASYEADLFSWIVSDFGLMDAIESGLTKTPRFVVRDDGPINPQNLKSKLYHIYDDEDVKSDLNRRAEPKEILPDLVRNAYLLLGHDWEKTHKSWEKSKMPTPPVMISAVNRKETAERIKYMFDKSRVSIPSLCDEEKTLRIYSDLESDKEEELREQVNTVGQIGKSGEKIRHVISVAMLTEGWDCKTVTHIMGLRAFSSQLLCEQVVGRGLRRTSYELNEDGMFEPEYVNIFGIPFSYIPQEESGSGNPRPPSPRMPIFPDLSKERYKITWPNVERIDFNLKPLLKVNFSKIESLHISRVRMLAELAPEINGEPDYEKIKIIDMEKLIQEKNMRMQTLLFTVTTNIYDQMDYEWKKKVNKEFAISQILDIVENFLHSEQFKIEPKSFYKDEVKKQIVIMMGMEEIVRKIFSAITHQNSEKLVPIYRNPKYKTTKDTQEWRTKKKTQIFKKTHMNRCVVDSSWEMAHARELDRNSNVEAWVKNDHLGFEIPYVHNGALRNYIPDFIVKLSNKNHLILEVKGIKKNQDDSKWDYMKTWVEAVSQDEENGIWHFAVSQDETGQKIHQIVDSIINEQPHSYV